MLEPIDHHAHRTDQPQKCVDQIYPYCVLHSLDPIVTLGVLLDIHAAEQSKQSNPQNEQDQVPDEKERDPDGERDDV